MRKLYLKAMRQELFLEVQGKNRQPKKLTDDQILEIVSLSWADRVEELIEGRFWVVVRIPAHMGEDVFTMEIEKLENKIAKVIKRCQK